MPNQASESYVLEVLALQLASTSPGADRSIAATLSTQLATAAPSYALLPFEAEPAGFLAVLQRAAA